MEQLPREDVVKYFKIANEYLKTQYPIGVDFNTLCKDETEALKLYLKFYSKNLKQGKIRYNSNIKKARIKWFILETIEKIMKMNNLDRINNLDFCFSSMEQQIDLFLDFTQKENYNSYLLDDELEK